MAKEERNILLTIKRMKVNCICHMLRWNGLLKHVIERKIQGNVSDKKGRKKTYAAAR
jgi:hypothetical protein